MPPSPERIAIKGFKSIRETEIELRPLNVLIGANGSGKSNFIEVFRLLRSLIAGGLGEYVPRNGGAGTLLHLGLKRTGQVSLEVGFGEYGYHAELMPTVQDSLVFRQESCWSGASRDEADSLGRGHSESRLREAWSELAAQANRRAMAWDASVHAGAREQALRRSPVRRVLDSIEGWTINHFHDTSSSAPVKLTGDISDNQSLRPDAGNLAAFLHLLQEQHAPRYRQIVDTVRLAAPFFKDFVLQPVRQKSDTIRLEWRHRGTDAYFDASSLSDGTLRFMCLATLLLQPALEETEATLIIDEPELGLHPYAITLLASMLREAASRATVIVSTQSVSLVNQFDPEDVIVVDREDEASVFRRLSQDDLAHWLQDYGLGDLWEKNVIGGRPTR